MFDRTEAIAKLEAICKKKMMSKSELARDIEISAGALARFMAGEEMKLFTLRRIKNYIDSEYE